MSESTDTIRTQLWEKMRDKPYRDTFVAAHLSTNIAAQIQTIREQRGWTKKLLAQKAGMSPSRITVMEDPSYEKFTLSTLKRLASAFDVALIARFTPFSDLVDWVAELSPEKLQTPEFETDSLSHRAKIPANHFQVGLGASTIPSAAEEPKRGFLVADGSPFSSPSFQPPLSRELSNIRREEQVPQTL